MGLTLATGGSQLLCTGDAMSDTGRDRDTMVELFDPRQGPHGAGVKGLWLGDKLDAASVLQAATAPEGICSVLNVSDKLLYPLEHHTLSLNMVPLSDHGLTELFKTGGGDGLKKSTQSPYELCEAFIQEALRKGPMLVHCEVGVNRSAITVVVFLMRQCGWSYRDAYGFVLRRRDIHVHVLYQKQAQLFMGISEEECVFMR